MEHTPDKWLVCLCCYSCHLLDIYIMVIVQMASRVHVFVSSIQIATAAAAGFYGPLVPSGALAPVTGVSQHRWQVGQL